MTKRKKQKPISSKFDKNLEVTIYFKKKTSKKQKHKFIEDMFKRYPIEKMMETIKL